MDFFAASISILTSIGLFTLKLRRVAQSDIKNDRIKIALIKANLYFNSDGRLVKKTEKMVGKDLDGDGIISDKEPEVTKGLFSGIATAIKEFHTIATADLSGNEEEIEEKYEKVLTQAELKDSEEALEEISETLKKGTTVMVLDGIESEIDKRKSDVMKDDDITKEEKSKKLNLFAGVKNMLRRKKKQVVEEQATEDVVVNNVEKDAETKEVTKVKAADVVKEMAKEQPVVVKKEVKPATSGKKSAQDVLNNLRK